MQDPYSILKDAIRSVPSLKYALGVLGIVSVLVIVKLFQLNPAEAWFGVMGVVVLMVVLLIFAAAATSKKEVFKTPAIFLIWSFLLISVASAVLLFSSAFFNWPRPLDDLVKSLVSDEATEIDLIATKDYPKVIQTPSQAYIMHLVGMPVVQLQIAFHNPYRGTLTLSHLLMTLRGPDGTFLTLPPEAVILLNGQWIPPIDGAVLTTGQSIPYAFSFCAYPAEFTLLLQKATTELNQKPALTSVPDPSSQNLSPTLTASFTEFMNRNFMWKTGAWTMDIKAEYGSGKEIHRRLQFNLEQSDIDSMKAISKYYASGIGIIYAIRFLPILDAKPGKLVDLTPIDE